MSCQVIDVKTNKVIFIGHCQGNVYVVYLDDLSSCDVYLKAKKEDENWMWHRRFDHANIHVINKMVKMELVITFSLLELLNKMRKWKEK